MAPRNYYCSQVNQWPMVNSGVRQSTSAHTLVFLLPGASSFISCLTLHLATPVLAGPFFALSILSAGIAMLVVLYLGKRVQRIGRQATEYSTRGKEKQKDKEGNQ